MRAKNCPECHWVFVVDAAGRRHLEMRWQPLVGASQAKAARAA
ncbi:hypothetical protein [Blastococcus sp. CT_GayMR20]|nr:hypothetical protein [Blastococcus sp. CT_GayMR20]